jgi:hypothetical protein
MTVKTIFTPVAIDPNRRYPVDVATGFLGQSRAKTYLDIRLKKIKVIKDGARTYIHGSEIIRRSAESDMPDILGMRPSITL